VAKRSPGFFYLMPHRVPAPNRFIEIGPGPRATRPALAPTALDPGSRPGNGSFLTQAYTAFVSRTPSRDPGFHDQGYGKPPWTPAQGRGTVPFLRKHIPHSCPGPICQALWAGTQGYTGSVGDPFPLDWISNWAKTMRAARGGFGCLANRPTAQNKREQQCKRSSFNCGLFFSWLWLWDR